jgi:L-lactate dehydrogenase complex protein LldG
METELQHSHLLIAQFSERATPLGTIVERAPDSAGAAGIIRTLVEVAGSERVSVGPQFADRAGELVAGLRNAGLSIEIVEGREDARDQPVGLTIADRAIAETGSVLLNERLLVDRAASLMTLHNIVVVAVADIVPSLDSTPAVLREIAMRPGGGYATFMTGPSRSADIEMSLTIGVQGPGQVTVLFVDNLT